MKTILNERYHINNLPNNIVLLSKGLNNNYCKFLLFDIEDNIPIGYIESYLYPSINSFTIDGVYSKKGYGAFLYECVMTYVYPNGVSMSREGSTSGDAFNVWIKFNQRTDVKKERIYSNEITHKQQDWINGGFLDDNKEYRQYLFDLEDTRFYYSFGIDKLNNLIKTGVNYMKENNITEEDVEHLSWDLEV